MLKKRMDKHGQFFLIAAVFIVLILIGTTGIASYTVVKPEPRTITDASAELNRETYNIVEYGVFSEVNKGEKLNEAINRFASEDIPSYFLKKSEDANIVFVYGNEKDVEAVVVNNHGRGKIKIGGSEVPISSTTVVKVKPTVRNGFAEIEVLDKNYFFEIKKNEMFYFLLVKERDGEVFVEKNKESKDNNRVRPGGVEKNTKNRGVNSEFRDDLEA